MSTRESALDLSVNRKRRGVARASITRMRARILDLETKERSSPVGLETARRLKQKLEDLDSDFKSHHYAIVDLIEEGTMDAEQTTLDEHDDRVTDLSIRL